jgi:ribosomal protein L37AE/L43A
MKRRIICPTCETSGRVRYRDKSKTYKCNHCGAEFKKPIIEEKLGEKNENL